MSLASSRFVPDERKFGGYHQDGWLYSLLNRLRWDGVSSLYESPEINHTNKNKVEDITSPVIVENAMWSHRWALELSQQSGESGERWQHSCRKESRPPKQYSPCSPEDTLKGRTADHGVLGSQCDSSCFQVVGVGTRRVGMGRAR
jgi:hypothetical protein